MVLTDRHHGITQGAMTAVTDPLLPELNAWKERPLESHYPIV